MPRIDHRNKADFWFARELVGVSLMHADFTTHNYPRHRHEAMVIAVTEGGGSVVETRDGSETLTNSQLLVLDPNEMHATRMGASQKWQYRAFYFEESALHDTMTRIGLQKIPNLTAKLLSDCELIAAFKTLHQAMHLERDPLLETELLVKAFSLMFQRYSDIDRPLVQSPRDVTLFRKLTSFIQDRLSEHLSLTVLSKMVDLSEFQLISLFKRTTGMTPHAFITQLRVDRAAWFLAKGTDISEIVHLVGFYDQSALTKYFKRCYGITPMRFALASRF